MGIIAERTLRSNNFAGNLSVAIFSAALSVTLLASCSGGSNSTGINSPSSNGSADEVPISTPEPTASPTDNSGNTEAVTIEVPDEVDGYPALPVVIGDLDIQYVTSNTDDSDYYTLARAVGDSPQESTMAFAAFSFYTGDQCMDTFFPPGKVADMFGFQATRDNDGTELGHNTDFTGVIADNIIALLNDEQKQQLLDLATTQVDSINDYAYGRLTLIEAFRQQLAGSANLSERAVMNFSGELYRLDGQLNLQRAQTLGAIVQSLSDTQKTELNALADLDGIANWPQAEKDTEYLQGNSHDITVAVYTYAGQLFTWYTGSIARDAYFAPERQGTYFGAFYLKDAPAMGNANYTIDSELTGGGGKYFLNTILNSTQRQPLTTLVEHQRQWVEGFAVVRYAMALRLREYMKGNTIDESEFLQLATLYGKLDGLLVNAYAKAFVEVSETLTEEQLTEMADLRSAMMNNNPFPCEGAYIYSQNVATWPLYSASEYYAEPSVLYETE